MKAVYLVHPCYLYLDDTSKLKFVFNLGEKRAEAAARLLKVKNVDDYNFVQAPMTVIEKAVSIIFVFGEWFCSWFFSDYTDRYKERMIEVLEGGWLIALSLDLSAASSVKLSQTTTEEGQGVEIALNHLPFSRRSFKGGSVVTQNLYAEQKDEEILDEISNNESLEEDDDFYSLSGSFTEEEERQRRLSGGNWQSVILLSPLHK